MTFGGEQFFQNANRVTRLYRVVDAFLGNADTPFTKSLEHVGFRHTLQTLKLQVANDRQLLDLKNDVYPAARAFFRQHTGRWSYQKTKRQNRLKIALICCSLKGSPGRVWT